MNENMGYVLETCARSAIFEVFFSLFHSKSVHFDFDYVLYTSMYFALNISMFSSHSALFSNDMGSTD